MSPTTISTMSSSETSPSVPPYSSMTSAICVRVACMRAIRSEASIEGGTNSTLADQAELADRPGEVDLGEVERRRAPVAACASRFGLLAAGARG